MNSKGPLKREKRKEPKNELCTQQQEKNSTCSNSKKSYDKRTERNEEVSS
jgi:hypothetical protein